MDNICRLCCSSKFVNNNIFDEENALYLKMSLYLPIKVFKNDRLPQRVCDKCSCKVNDFYQFCNEAIEVQHRLRAVLITSGVESDSSIDLTLIKRNHLSPVPAAVPDGVHKVEPSGDTGEHGAPCLPYQPLHRLCDRSTQTEDLPAPTDLQPSQPPPLFPNIKIKEEPKHTQFKEEDEDYPVDITDHYYEPAVESDCSEDNVTLSTIKRERKKRKKQSNGERPRKKKPKLKELEELVGTALALVPGLAPAQDADTKPVAVKVEPMEYHCCICFTQCYSRPEMLHHYKEHAAAALGARGPPPVPPPPPDHSPIKCIRCQKSLERVEWGAHWLAHWERDARPLRCALCDKTFRDSAQVLRHGLTHKAGGAAGEAAGEGPGKRFACDICGEAFVYMRCLLAHRLSAHPEAATRALALRCALCARTFAHLNSLRRHLRAHTGERNFLCSVCGKALSSREHLKFHLRIHSGYKPNVCKTCGKGFVKKCNLTLHERVHSGEKPHVCAHCGKAFSQRSTLVIHERYHSGARPYTCALCGRGFVAKGLLSMHLKTTCI